ncbi:putative Trichohyalin [Neospora caninum Liverpool]|uniref:Putative Trichohyalin n=1 Tax=Neospora caninum (strain Liverpool) TaxID=572307 RepID=F0VPF5_NEOCL|nr:putative Trichohyalin [Neospora caninum Liverpool]CBZ55601.1 putative Trichohyalin [Neospora caninum Liverpool]CEL70343.1 TPA: Trichohyalin, putative [Neospora caninum Liverpool]|eukprot:XP_003885629.1 putative Trichohyalin [Neospora caninum Liverpool]
MQPPAAGSCGGEGGEPPALSRRESAGEARSGTAMLDLDMVEKLKQKYIKCKQQNDRLKEVLLQMQQHGEQKASSEHQEQLATLQRQVEQLQQQLKVRDMEQRQHLEELDALQYTNRKQQQQLQQLQQATASASGGLAGAGGGTKWGIALLAGASTGNAAREESERRLTEELQVLRDELEHKIRENEQLHVQQFEEKQRQQVQQERLARLDEELQQAQHACQQLRHERAETERRAQTQEVLYQEEREQKRQLEERFRELKNETHLQLTRLSEQKDTLQLQQAQLRRYFRRRLPVDLRRFRLLASYDVPCGGAAAVLAAYTVAERQVTSATGCLLVRLQQLLAAWSEALCSGGGRTGAGDSHGGADSGLRGGAISPQGTGERSLSDGPADVSAAGLVAIGGKDRDRSQGETVRPGVNGARQHAVPSGGNTTAAVSGIHFKLTVANQKALDALLEARKSIDPVKRYLLQKLVAPRESGDAVGLPRTWGYGEEGTCSKNDRSPRGGFHTRESELQCDGREHGSEGVVTAVEAQSRLRQLRVAIRRFISFSLVSLTLETDAFPILDNPEEAANADAFEPSPGSEARWSARPGSGGAGPSSGSRSQTGDARRSTTAFIEASRRFAKCLSVLLEVAQLLFFPPGRPQEGAAPDPLPEVASQASGWPNSLRDFLDSPDGARQRFAGSRAAKKRATREKSTSGTSPGGGVGELLPSEGPKACVEALTRLSHEHFRVLRSAVAPRESEEPDEEALANAGEADERAETDEAGKPVHSGSQPPVPKAGQPSGTRFFRQEEGEALFAAAEKSAVARAAAISAVKHDVAKHFLQQVFFRHLDEAMMNMATMEGCISARMCRPHVVEGHLLPLSGGSDAMVDLVQALKLIDSYIPFPALLPHLSSMGAKKAAMPTSDSAGGSPSSSHWTAARSELVSMPMRFTMPEKRKEGTNSTVAVLREGLGALVSSRLALWSRFLRLPVLDSALYRLQDFMRTRQDALRSAPPRMLRDDALYFREEVQRLTEEEQRLHRRLESVQLDYDEVLEERDQLMQDKDELRDRYAVMQTRFELARGGFSSHGASALQRPLQLGGENERETIRNEAATVELSGPRGMESKRVCLQRGTARTVILECSGLSCVVNGPGSQHLGAAVAAVAAEDACAAAAKLMVMARGFRLSGSETSLPALGCPSREAAAAMMEAALLQRGSIFRAASESAVSTAATDAAEAVIASLEACEGTGDGKSAIESLEYQQELRQVYVQQVQQLLQHVQTSEDALAALKMQLSSCLKTIHALDSQRHVLQRQLQEQQSAAAAAASAARLAEVKYMEQLSVLSEHYCQEGEKRKAVEVHMDDMRKQRVLCGRCGVWNSLGFLLGATSGGACTMCHGRVIEPPA